ncbi:hypothetical protein [Crucivirus-538]|nr:hypothetical protein [Crucivirus-538]
MSTDTPARTLRINGVPWTFILKDVHWPTLDNLNQKIMELYVSFHVPHIDDKWVMISRYVGDQWCPWGLPECYDIGQWFRIHSHVSHMEWLDTDRRLIVASKSLADSRRMEEILKYFTRLMASRPFHGGMNDMLPLLKNAILKSLPYCNKKFIK